MLNGRVSCSVGRRSQSLLLTVIVGLLLSDCVERSTCGLSRARPMVHRFKLHITSGWKMCGLTRVDLSVCRFNLHITSGREICGLNRVGPRVPRLNLHVASGLLSAGSGCDLTRDFQVAYTRSDPGGLGRPSVHVVYTQSDPCPFQLASHFLSSFFSRYARSDPFPVHVAHERSDPFPVQLAHAQSDPYLFHVAHHHLFPLSAGMVLLVFVIRTPTVGVRRRRSGALSR